MSILFNLYANWPAPANITALTTTRAPGVSPPPYESNNLALHVGDDPHAVKTNRLELARSLQLNKEPEWLEQIHSNICVVVEEEDNRRADAAITRSSKHVLAIMTADCLPILLCDTFGREVAAIHSGWRGLLSGVIENTLAKLQSLPSNLLAWIGPAICVNCYEVGEEVLDSFKKQYPFAINAFYSQNERWLADLPKLAELVLNSLGIHAVYQAQKCTFEHKNEFYSYRRASQTGRIATLIWLNETQLGK